MVKVLSAVLPNAGVEMEIFQQDLGRTKRILLVQYGSLGETVRSVPLLVALRTRYPLAEIAWLAEQCTAKVLDGHWALNRLMIAPKGWYKCCSSVRQLRRQIRRFAPRIVFDLQATFFSSLLTTSFRKQQLIRYQHSRGGYLQLAEHLGIIGSSVAFDLPVCNMDKRSAEHKLRQAGFHGNYAVLNVSAVSESARWEAERFGQVAKYLLDQWNLPSLIFYSKPEDAKHSAAAVAASAGAAVSAPYFTAGELSATLARATVFISSDSEYSELASALETRCIGIYGCTIGTERIPFGQHNSVVQVRHPVRTADTRSFIDAVDTDLVCSIADKTLTEILQPNILPVQKFKIPSEPARKAA